MRISTGVSGIASTRSAIILLRTTLSMTVPYQLKTQNRERADGQGKDISVNPARRRQHAPAGPNTHRTRASLPVLTRSRRSLAGVFSASNPTAHAMPIFLRSYRMLSSPKPPCHLQKPPMTGPPAQAVVRLIHHKNRPARSTANEANQKRWPRLPRAQASANGPVRPAFGGLQPKIGV